MAKQAETKNPIVVVLAGVRYVLTSNGVTRVVSVPDYTPRRAAR